MSSRILTNWRITITDFEVRITEGESIAINNPTTKNPRQDTIDDSAGQYWRTLQKSDIKSIKLYEGNRISVVGTDGRTVFPLGIRLHPFDELLTAVATLGDVKVASRYEFNGKRGLILYGPVVAFAIGTLASSMWIKLIFGTLAMVGFIYRVVLLFRYSKEIPRNWMLIALFIMLTICALVMSVTGLASLLLK